MSFTPTAEVAAKLRAEMAYQRRPHAELAALWGCSQAAVSRRLVGDVPIDVNELAGASALLGKPVTDFLPAPTVAAVSA